MTMCVQLLSLWEASSFLLSTVDDESQEKGRNLAGETDDAEEEGGIGSTQTKNEPARGDSCHPGADHGQALTGKEEPVIAVPQRTKCELQSGVVSVLSRKFVR